MRIATWNINGLRARLDFLLIWLADRLPDLVALQELKLEDEQFPHAEIEAAGYRAATHGQKAWNGVAILSREALTVEQTGLPGQEEMGARLLTAHAGEISLTSLYCPNGKHLGHDDYPRKLAWFDTLADHLEATGAAGRAAVVAGDFNICPSALDSWNEKALGGSIFHTEEERQRFQRLLDLGLTDAYRGLYPDRQAFSWWDYRAGGFHRNHGLRIDFLLASSSVVGRLRGAEIDRDYRKKKEGLTASDHAPVWIDLDPSP
jgi:exodeoxyribonuclease-3